MVSERIPGLKVMSLSCPECGKPFLEGPTFTYPQDGEMVTSYYCEEHKWQPRPRGFNRLNPTPGVYRENEPEPDTYFSAGVRDVRALRQTTF